MQVSSHKDGAGDVDNNFVGTCPNIPGNKSNRNSREGVTTVAILASVVLVVLDGAVANVALPAIGQSLHVMPELSVLVVTAYQLALVMALLPCAALGESCGYRNIFMLGVAVFTGASVLCALSPSLLWLVTGRFLQGLGGSAIMSLGVPLLRQVVQPSRFGAAIGRNALAVSLSAAVGPVIGSVILSIKSWPWLFAVNLPLGILVLFVGRSLPLISGSSQRIDLLSVVLNAGVFGSFAIGAELLASRPALAAICFLGTVTCLVALVRRQLFQNKPLFPIDLLRLPSFRDSVIASTFCFTGLTAGLVALPFYLQHNLHQSILLTGLFIAPWPLTAALMALVTTHLTGHVPTASLCTAGGVVLAIGLVAISLWPINNDVRPLVGFIILCGMGFGLFQVPNTRNMFFSAPHERSGAVGGVQSTARLTGQTLGAVLMSLLFSFITPDIAPRIGMAIGAVLASAAGLASASRLYKRSSSSP